MSRSSWERVCRPSKATPQPPSRWTSIPFSSMSRRNSTTSSALISLPVSVFISYRIGRIRTNPPTDSHQDGILVGPDRTAANYLSNLIGSADHPFLPPCRARPLAIASNFTFVLQIGAAGPTSYDDIERRARSLARCGRSDFADVLRVEPRMIIVSRYSAKPGEAVERKRSLERALPAPRPRATDPDWNSGLLHGRRQKCQLIDMIVLATEAERFRGPQPNDNFEGLVRHLRSRLEVGRLAKLAQTPIQFRIAQPDPQDSPAAGEMIERQDSACQLPWPTPRQRRHQGSEPQTGRAQRHGRERAPRIVNRQVPVGHRMYDVVLEQDCVPARFFCELGHVCEHRRISTGAIARIIPSVKHRVHHGKQRHSFPAAWFSLFIRF